MVNIKKIDYWLHTAQLICTKTDGKGKYDFNNVTFPSKFTLKIYCHDLTLQEAEDDQQELQILINKLNFDYNPKNPTKNKRKRGYLIVCKKIVFHERKHY